MTRAENYDREVALDAAMTLFWEKGYHATSIKDLEGALSMKPGSIYAAFKSKDALFRACLQRYYDQGSANFSATLSAAPDILSALQNHLLSYVSSKDALAPKQACMIVKTILETSTPSPAIADFARDLFDQTRDGFRKAIETGQKDGVISAEVNAETLAKRFQADVTTLRLDAQIETDRQQSTALAETMVAGLEALRT